MQPKSPPTLFRHQQELLDRTWELAAWAIFWQTGVGKTSPVIHTAARLFQQRKIDAAIVVAPNMVHRNWITDEIPMHSPIAWRGLDWHSSRAKAQDRAFKQLIETRGAELTWFAITYDGMLTPRGRQAIYDFLARFPKILLVIDEASRVKNPEALRTKKVAALRKMSTYVRLLNGTPIGSSATDVYAQLKILDDQFWIRHGFGSWTAFQSRFCVMRKIVIGGEDESAAEKEANDRGGKKKCEPIVPYEADAEGVAAFEQLALSGLFEENPTRASVVAAPPDARIRASGRVATTSVVAASPDAPIRASGGAATTGRIIEVPVGYRDLDKLHEMIQPISSRLTKEQAGLDLPPKLYQRIVFDLAPDQRRVYDQLRKEYMVELDNGVLVTAALAMVRILRLQQVASGYLPNPDDPEAEPILVPSAENPRLRAFMDWLEDVGKQQLIVWCRFTHDVDIICRELGPPRCVRYDGLVGEKQKAEALDLFRSGRRQICVAKASSMGMGLTLVNSSISFYYSNTFSLLERLQSEDRQHRPGQHNPVTYVDLIADRTVDLKILTSLREDHEVARKVVGDAYRSWLEEE
jgi:SNF2-related domain